MNGSDSRIGRYGSVEQQRKSSECLNRTRRKSTGGRLNAIWCCASCCRKRYLTAVLCNIGFVITFGFRCSIGVATGHFRDAIGSNETAHSHSGSVLTTLASASAAASKPVTSSVHWSTSVISTVESSYFWGYLISQVPAGILANRVPATLVYSMSILGSSVLNLLLPVCIRTSLPLTIVVRVLQGLLEGCTYPACNGILSHWAPPLERSRLSTIIFSGGYIGSFFGLMTSGWLSEKFGWPVMFYIYGSLGIVWFCIFTACVYEKPSTDQCISSEERVYIELAIGENIDVKHMIHKTPWQKIFTSMPVYAIVVAFVARNWTFCLMITEPTKYFGDVFSYDMSKSGLFAAMPHLIMSIVVPVSGIVADELRKRFLTTTAVRKIFNSAGFGIQGIFLLGVGYSNNATTAIVCMTIAVGFSGLSVAGYNANHLDIAPRYASFLMGLSNGIGTLSSILVPVVTIELVRDRSRASWSTVFLITSLINFACVIFYAIFASGEKQDWAGAPADEEPWQPPSPTSLKDFNNDECAEDEVFDDADGGLSGKLPLFPTMSTFAQKSF